MAVVYLNVGVPKTGTSSWQHFLMENEERLHKQGVTYPNMSKALGIKGKENRNAYFLLRSGYGGETPDEELLGQAWCELGKLAKQYKKIILADEGLWSKAYNREKFWPNLTKDFQKIGCELKVTVYLRRQDELIQSLWNQHVKENLRLNKSFEECINSGHYDYFPLDYYEILTDISHFVGKENLLIRVYEKEQFQGEEHTVLSDFLNLTGIEMDPEFTYETKKNNVSLHGNFVEIRRRINEMPDYKASEDFVWGSLTKANRFMDPSFHAEESFFDYESQVDYLKRFEESNRKTAVEFLNRQDGRLFYQPIEKKPMWEVNYKNLGWDMLALNMEIFMKQQKEIERLKNEVLFLKRDVNAVNKSLIFRIYRKIRRLTGKNKDKN